MKVKAVKLHKVPVADRTAPLPGPIRRGRGCLAPRTAIGPAGLESRSGPCVHRAHSPQSKLIRDWLERHSTAWKLQVLRAGDKITCHSLKATYKLQSSIHKQESKNLVEKGGKNRN